MHAGNIEQIGDAKLGHTLFVIAFAIVFFVGLMLFVAPPESCTERLLISGSCEPGQRVGVVDGFAVCRCPEVAR